MPSRSIRPPTLSTTRVGGYHVAATEDSKIAIGRFPMLMLSHGNTGTPLALHDLATSLARKGFVVVAVLHPGDNYKDHSRLGTLSNLYGRPIQISEAITATLGDPMLSPFVNVDQVGVIGYSAGGETALILAGAKPDFDRLRRDRQERPEDRDACTTKGELVVDRDDLQPQADPRIHALMLMAPLSLMFGATPWPTSTCRCCSIAVMATSWWRWTRTPPPWRASCRTAGLQIAGRGRAFRVHGALRQRSTGADAGDLHRCRWRRPRRHSPRSDLRSRALFRSHPRAIHPCWPADGGSVSATFEQQSHAQGAE